MRVDADRLWGRVEELARFTDPGRPWTRRAFSPLHVQSRAWLADSMEKAGLTVRLDEAGNLIGRREGRRDLPVLATGSHCDTVVEGGRFDGIIGVLAGIEIAQALQESGTQLEHPFEVIDFLAEEPSDYGISCVGSRGMVGLLDASMLASPDSGGEVLAQGMLRVGARPEVLGPALRAPGSMAAFVELHIEQGPVLESRGLPIGVVSHIVGLRRVALSVLGRPDHAGTTPMDLRRDALVGAARLIDAIQRRASGLAGRSHYVVATVGRIDISPNASNAVPGRVDMTLDVRSDDSATLDTFVETVLQEQAAALEEVRVAVRMRELSRSNPTICHAGVMKAIEAAADRLGMTSMVLPSGAGHDAAYMARLGPMGMVFIPCREGRSHCPEEWVEPEQLWQGTRVLAETLLQLDVLPVQP